MVDKHIILGQIKEILELNNKLKGKNRLTEDEYRELQSLENSVEDGWTNKEWNENKKRLSEYLKGLWSELYKKAKQEKEQDFSEKEIKELVQKSSIEQKLKTNKEEFLKLFGYSSIGNKLAGKMLYHSFISLICKSVNLEYENLQGTIIKPITHTFWIQNTGSGKDLGLDFFSDLLRLLNKEIKNYIVANKDNKLNLKIVTRRELSGVESAESFLNRYELDKKGKVVVNKNKKPQTVLGILSRYDLITSSECSFLFRSGGNSERQGKGDMLLKALEGKTLTKDLVSWAADNVALSTETKFDGVFVGASRPVFNMKAHLAYSGLQQRGLNFCRNLSNTDRGAMSKELKNIGLLKARNSNWKKDIKTRKEKLINEFFEMMNFLKGIEIKVKGADAENINNLIEDRNNAMYKEINDTVLNKEHRHILEGFVSRFHFLVNILACHNCISRFDNEVTLMDYQNGMSLLKESFGHLKEWVCENIQSDAREENKFDRLFISVMQKFENGKGISRSALIMKIRRFHGCAENWAYQIIKKWESDGLLIEEVREIKGNFVKALYAVNPKL